ncbi:MAG TPA: hypothetical protein VFQ96_04060 [Microbacteriaceae bacterium]|nr:hypothetical protein [Microbacteriaceae bacterium]
MTEDLVRGRVAASVILAACIAIGTAGCTFATNQDTKNIKETAFGVSGATGDVSVHNAALITGEGSSANLVVTLVDSGTKSQVVTIQTPTKNGKSTQTVTVTPANPLQIGGQDGSQRIQFDSFGAAAGTLHDVYFQSGDGNGVALKVPVLTNQLPTYATLTPTPQPAGTLQ